MKRYRCPLCQFVFDDRSACQGCVMTTGCALLKCPNCGYEFAEDAPLVSRLIRFFHWLKRKKGNERKKP